MILSEKEAIQLRKLADSEHPVEIELKRGRYRLNLSKESAWALREVIDWRTQHPNSCPCFHKKRDGLDESRTR